jgi:hypothetical protein
MRDDEIDQVSQRAGEDAIWRVLVSNDEIFVLDSKSAREVVERN